MSNKIIDLIKRVCIETNVSTNSNFTHVLTYPEMKKININSMEYGSFWVDYCQLVDDGSFACLAERVPEIIPLIVDLNLKFRIDDEDITTEYYSDSFILSVISCIQQVIINNFQVETGNEKELICFYLESESHFFTEEIIEDNETIRAINFGMRFQFPYCRTTADFINDTIYPDIIKLFGTHNIYKRLSKAIIFSWRETLDKDLIKRGYIHLYGSVNKLIESRRVLHKIYLRINKDHIEGNQDIDECDNVKDALHLDKHPHVINGFIEIDTIKQYLDSDEEDYTFWLPLLLSLYNLNQIITQNKPKAKKPLYLTKSQEIDTLYDNNNQRDDNSSLFETFYKMCKPERFLKKMYYMDLGKVIYKVYQGADEGLKKWINLLDKSINPDICEEYYSSFYSSNITIKTLAYYAKEDNPAEYNRWRKASAIEALNIILKASNIYDDDVGNFIYKIAWLDFVYATTNGRDGNWYKYTGNRWVCSGRGLELKTYMSGIVISFVQEHIDVLLQESISARDDITKAIKQNNVQRLQKLVAKLKENPSKTRFMASLEQNFHFENFTKLLDDNVTCIGHQNCVSEAIDRKVEFRPGKPEDFILKSTGIRIDTNMTWEHHKVKAVLKWFHQLFPDNELREFMLKYNGSWFEGGNFDKFGPCLYGKSNGGKSTYVKATEHCWGDLCFKFQNSTVYAKKGFASSGPTPELAQARGSRGGIVDELEDDIEISAGVIKKYLGGDTFFCRFLHDNGGKTKVSFKMMFVTNRVPRMNSMDESIKGKFFLVPFVSTWANGVTEEMMKLDPYLFQADATFEASLATMAPAMLWIYAQYYSIYKNEGLKIPIIVKKMSEKYWKDIDHFSLFKNQKINKVAEANGLPNKNVKLDINRLFSEFKSWFKQTFENERVTTYRDFKLEFIRILGDLDESESFWYGYQLKTDDQNTTGVNALKQSLAVAN